MANAENTSAAAASTPAPRKRKAQGPRKEKPIFALFSYTDADGTAVKLDAERLTCRFTKDPAQLAKWFTSGEVQEAAFKEVTIGEDRPSPATTAA